MANPAAAEEVRFLAVKRDIDNYASVGDYRNALKAIEEAMGLCRKIFSLTPDAKKKEVMKENAAALKRMYQSFQARLGEAAELIYETAPAPHKPKPAPSKPSAPQKGGDPKEPSPGDKEIQYLINGVDVKSFLSTESNDPVTFDDVKGMEEEKALIEREFFLTEEEREFNAFLGKKPKTFILLYGVPGTGKTFFAKAISEELKLRLGGDVPFFSVVGSQLSDSKVGMTERNIQAVFEFCKQFEHCVLFIDEFDTIAPDRKEANGDPTAASRVTVLLQMMDGFSSAKGTLVIAATNCPYNLDGAILSRANTRIEIPLPSYEVIYGTLDAKIGRKVAPEVDLSALAVRLNGYSNRDVKNFLEALKDLLADEFRAARKNGSDLPFESFKFTNDMILKALAKVVPTTKLSDLERIAAFKERGE